MLSVSEFPVEDDLGEPLVIGLVNNMPDAALRATERQFHDLLTASSPNRRVRLRYFSLAEVFRGEAAQSHINRHYENPGELWAGGCDGLIVTGTEPRASRLEDEPYWTALTKLADWADGHTISTVWSCLAAHAAVLHLDGIVRRPLPRKLCGVFDCVKSAEKEILAELPSRWSVPHSRHNGLPEDQLAEHGYQIISRSDETGADSFVMQRNSLFVFFQGHPEYGPDALLREYRRDAGRFLAGERSDYPEMPQGYFNAEAVGILSAFRDRALSDRKPGLIEHFPIAGLEGKHSYAWREPALRIYSNWIEYLATRKYRSRNNGVDEPLHQAQK
jgi:homoserine O-succinyltransferase